LAKAGLDDDPVFSALLFQHVSAGAAHMVPQRKVLLDGDGDTSKRVKPATIHLREPGVANVWLDRIGHDGLPNKVVEFVICCKRLRGHVHTVRVDSPHALEDAVAVHRDLQDAPRTVTGRVWRTSSFVVLVNSAGLQRHKLAQVVVALVMLLAHALLRDFASGVGRQGDKNFYYKTTTKRGKR